jgi:hypothetical protein
VNLLELGVEDASDDNFPAFEPCTMSEHEAINVVSCGEHKIAAETLDAVHRAGV